MSERTFVDTGSAIERLGGPERAFHLIVINHSELAPRLGQEYTRSVGSESLKAILNGRENDIDWSALRGADPSVVMGLTLSVLADTGPTAEVNSFLKDMNGNFPGLFQSVREKIPSVIGSNADDRTKRVFSEFERVTRGFDSSQGPVAADRDPAKILHTLTDFLSNHDVARKTALTGVALAIGAAGTVVAAANAYAAPNENSTNNNGKANSVQADQKQQREDNSQGGGAKQPKIVADVIEKQKSALEEASKDNTQKVETVVVDDSFYGIASSAQEMRQNEGAPTSSNTIDTNQSSNSSANGKQVNNNEAGGATANNGNSSSSASQGSRSNEKPQEKPADSSPAPTIESPAVPQPRPEVPTPSVGFVESPAPEVISPAAAEDSQASPEGATNDPSQLPNSKPDPRNENGKQNNGNGKRSPSQILEGITSIPDIADLIKSAAPVDQKSDPSNPQVAFTVSVVEKIPNTPKTDGFEIGSPVAALIGGDTGPKLNLKLKPITEVSTVNTAEILKSIGIAPDYQPTVKDPLFEDLVEATLEPGKEAPPMENSSESSTEASDGGDEVSVLRKSLVDFGAPDSWVDYTIKYAKEYNLAPELLTAQQKQESQFDANAVSKTGAEGPAQFLNDAWRQAMNALGLPLNSDKKDPAIAIRAQAYYLDWCRELTQKYKKQGLVSGDDTELMLAAYVDGHGKVLSSRGPNTGEQAPKYIEKISQYQDEIHQTLSRNTSDDNSQKVEAKEGESLKDIKISPLLNQSAIDMIMADPRSDATKAKIFRILNTAIEHSDERRSPVARNKPVAPDRDSVLALKKLGYNTGAYKGSPIYDCFKTIRSIFVDSGVDPVFNSRMNNTTGAFKSIKREGGSALGSQDYEVLYNLKKDDMRPGDLLLRKGHIALWTGSVKGSDGNNYAAMEAALASSRVFALRSGSEVHNYFKSKGEFMVIRMK